MGFFYTENNTKKKSKKVRLEASFYQENACKVCSLKNQNEFKPKGSDKPIVYILFDKISDFDKQFKAIAQDYFDKVDIRYNYCLRCTSDKFNINDIECCRKSIEEDIKKYKPLFIIGTGKIVLQWFLKQSQVKLWRGRIVPVEIQGFNTWFFPVGSPTDIFEIEDKKQYENIYAKVLHFDMQRLLGFLEDYKKPKIYNNHLNNIEIITVANEKNLKLVSDWLVELKEVKEPIAIDIETTGLYPWFDHKLLTIAIGTYDKIYVFPVEFNDFWGHDKKIILDLIKDFLLNTPLKLAHNLKFELTWFLYYFGKEVLFETEWTCTQAQAYVLDERYGGGIQSLDLLCLQYFGFNLKSLFDLDIQTPKNDLWAHNGLEKEDIKDLLQYNGCDVKYDSLLYSKQRICIDKFELLHQVEKLQNQNAISYACMESKGLLIDLKKNKEIQEDLRTKIDDLEDDIQESDEAKVYKKEYGRELKHSSPKDLIVLFRDVLKLKRLKSTPGGLRQRAKNIEDSSYAVDESTLVKFAEKGVSIASKIIEFRKAAKLKSTYIDPIEGLLDKNLILHPNFKDKDTDTGRSVSSD